MPPSRPEARGRGAPNPTVEVSTVEVSTPGVSTSASFADIERVLGTEQLRRLRDKLTAAATRPLPPGTTVDVRSASPDVVQSLFVRALPVAAGLDPTRADEVKSVLWVDGRNQLLVHLDQAKVALGDGFIDTHLVVQCDQTQRTSVVVTFVTSTAKRPSGFIVATEDRPRGPSVIVDAWGEALVALAWRAVIEVARVVAGTAGLDKFERQFVAANVEATTNALLITPMVPHRL